MFTKFNNNLYDYITIIGSFLWADDLILVMTLPIPWPDDIRPGCDTGIYMYYGFEGRRWLQEHSLKQEGAKRLLKMIVVGPFLL